MAHTRSRGRDPKKVLLFLALLALLCLGFLLYQALTAPEPAPEPVSPQSSGELTVRFLDVGQGDSILLTTDKTSLLIDASYGEMADRITEDLFDAGITHLTAVLGTHPHADHIGGMAQIIETFTPDSVILPRASANTKSFENMLDAVSAQGKTVTTAYAGRSLQVGDLTLDLLWPPEGETFEEVNNYSVCVRLTYNGRTFLFTGDMEKDAEERLINWGEDLSCDVLKVGHHGSAGSTCKEFLLAAAPRYAVISVGADNSYGHPKAATLKRLEKQGVTVFRTDEDGTVTARVAKDGTLTMETEREREENAA